MVAISSRKAEIGRHRDLCLLPCNRASYENNVSNVYSMGASKMVFLEPLLISLSLICARSIRVLLSPSAASAQLACSILTENRSYVLNYESFLVLK